MPFWVTHKKWRRHFCVKCLHFSGRTVRILLRIEEKPECTHQLFEKINHSGECKVYIVFPPSIKSTKMVIFGPKCIEKSKMSKIIGKTQKSHHDVIVTSLWRHKAVFRTCFHSFAISFLLIWWSSNYISDIVIFSNSILKVFETMRRLDVIWRHKTSKYSCRFMLNVRNFAQNYS